MLAIKQRSMKVLIFLLVGILTACTTDDYSKKAPQLIVEGNEESYPLFEAAAKACAYTEFWRFPGFTTSNNIAVPPHFNLFSIDTGAARCATDWVFKHPETGLQVSPH